MAATKPTAKPGKSGEIFQGKEKQRDIRLSNIVAAKALADVIRTSLGPKGMDKMIISADGDTTITNDGATILNKMDVTHPAAKMLVDVSKAQDVEAGDGTTTVVVIAGALLAAAEELLDKGIHPSVIADAFYLAQKQSEEILKSIAIPVDLSNRQALTNAALTSLNSKVVCPYAEKLAPLAADAVLRIIDPKSTVSVDLQDIKVVKLLGGTVDDTELIDGVVFPQSVSHEAGGPTKIHGAKIGLIQFCLSAPKTNMENSIVIEDYQQVDRMLKEERTYIQKLVKPIIKSGCNVLLIQKSILRDAVNELSLHYLAKAGVMVIKDIERTEIEFIGNSLGCQPVADANSFVASKLGSADLAEEISTPGGKMVKITGVKNPGRTVSVLVRGSNRLVLDEAERSLHDALCVVRCLVKQRFLIPGGAAPETEVSLQLAKYAESLGGTKGFCIKAFARSLELIPYTLAENAGLKPIEIVTELRKRHACGEKTTGINVRKGEVSDILDEHVLQPLLVSTSAINLAAEVTRMLLKIDDIVNVR